MECLAVWASKRGRALSLYGLELNAALANVARERLPALADRIFTGNVSDWVPPRAFTYVRTGLEYVGTGREPQLVARLFGEMIADDGRVIVGPVSQDAVTATIDALRAAGSTEIGVESARDRNRKTRHVVWGAKPSAGAVSDA